MFIDVTVCDVNVYLFQSSVLTSYCYMYFMYSYICRSALLCPVTITFRQTGTKGVAQDADKIVMECVMGLLEIASAQQLQESQGSPSVSGSLELKLVYHPFYTAAAKVP